MHFTAWNGGGCFNRKDTHVVLKALKPVKSIANDIGRTKRIRTKSLVEENRSC